MDLSVNGSTVAPLNFPASGEWTTWITEEYVVSLNAGTNTIHLTATTSGGAPNIDKMDITISCGAVVTPVPISTPSPTEVPGTQSEPPSDAIILFDSEINTEWVSEDGGAVEWEVKDSILTIKAGTGSIYTKRAFADCQLHVEWRSPEEISGEGQGRGNSGVFLQSYYEVQILDSYQNPTYPDGQAGAIYKQHIPLVNVSCKPGEWQTYDITYIAPRFNNDGTLKMPAYITVIHNDVIIHDYVQIKGRTVNSGQPQYKKHPFCMPLSLQEHGNPVSFRNIWIREINKQNLFNGNDFSGWYTYLEKHGKNNDPDNIFTIKDNEIHILGKDPGYLCTENEYENYYLRVVFRWGDKKFPPRENDKRDSGILYHFSKNSNDKVWPKSIECQVQEGDCGDIWLVGGVDIETDNNRKSNRIFRTADFENPKGEWNIIGVICNGNQIEHYVNGHLVNSGINATVSKGKILLQSEWAEVFYKSVELIPF